METEARRSKVCLVTAPEAKTSGGRSLSDLRRVHPTDATLQNLLTLLRSELDLCARLPVFEFEASSEGHDECATVFRALADVERNNVEQLLTTLQHHLAGRAGARDREVAS